MKYRMGIAYDGTAYGGWQIQKNAPSIQEEIEKALTILLRSPISIVGSGRTDAGVHALCQVAHFEVPNPLDLYRFHYALNAILPRDIRILWMEEVASQFHARYDALSKTYHYHLHLHPVTNPFQSAYSYHVPYPIDKKLLVEGARLFVGTHDFTAFSNESHHGSCAKDPVRTLYRLDVVEEEEGVRLEFEGTGFLYKMVRNIVGTLIDVSRKKISVAKISQIFDSKSRQFAGMAAPPHGLFLVSVTYNLSGGISKNEEKKGALNSLQSPSCG